MKTIIFKGAMTLIVLSIAFFGFSSLATNHDAQEEGRVRVVIVDETNRTVFDDTLVYYQGDTFFDVLNRAFELTCANGHYEEDPTCTYTFSMAQSNEKVLLSIKGETFDIKTNWQDTFLAIEYYDVSIYRMYAQGITHMSYTDKDHIRISVKTIGSSS